MNVYTPFATAKTRLLFHDSQCPVIFLLRDVGQSDSHVFSLGLQRKLFVIRMDTRPRVITMKIIYNDDLNIIMRELTAVYQNTLKFS